MGRYALLVGISNYPSDRSLAPLPRAVLDVEALRQVLTDPEIGGFEKSDVAVLKDADETTIRSAIYELFAKCRPEDLVLFYFSGHGVVDDRDKFYLTGSTTQTNSLPPTAVSSKYIHDEMNGSRSQHQVIILDCCNSGAFPDGMKGNKSVMVKALPELGGEGRAILAASDSSQYAFEEKGFELSLYTHFLVEGLKTGAADRDEDGQVSVNELHLYTEEKVKSVNDRMTPKFYGFMKEGQPIFLAKAAQGDPKLKFRKEVEKIVVRSNGVISAIAKNSLARRWQELGIISLEAEAIINEVLRPYREYTKKLEDYEQTLSEAIVERFPFNAVMQAELKDYEAYLGLREEDIKAIKNRLIPKFVIKPPDLTVVTSVISRRNFLTFLGLAGGGLGGALVLSNIKFPSSPEPESTPTPTTPPLSTPASTVSPSVTAIPRRPSSVTTKIPSTSKAFTFDVVKVDGTGKEIERKSSQVESLIYDFRNGITLDMVNIPAGEFMMGMPPAERQIALDNYLKYGRKKEDAEKDLDWSTPPHKVTIKEAFWMGKFTVTNALWNAVMGTEPSKQFDVKFQGKNQPVVGVSWHDCNKFCKELSVLTGKEFRLPTEAEWEYACRANTTTPFHFGDTITPDLVNYNSYFSYGNAPKGEYRKKTVDVGSFSSNAWGLYQMHGNVWEWCLDEWHDNYSSKPESLKDNGSEPWGEIKVADNYSRSCLVRGGSWVYGARECRSAFRSKTDARLQYLNNGFRVVCRLQ